MLKLYWVSYLFLILCFSSYSSAQNNTINVIVSGLDNPLLENVKKQLSINLDKKSNTRPQSLHAKAPEEIRKALQPFGYYHPSIQSNLSKKGDGWRAEYHIDRGKPMLINNVSIIIEGQGHQDAFIQQFVDNIDVKKGDIINHVLYESTKKELINLAFDRGYIDVTYSKSEIRVNLENYKADVNLVLSTGDRYFFGDINIEQNILNKQYLQRYVKIKKGAVYRSQSLLNLQIDLINTNYFKNVDIKADKERAVDNQIPVTIKADPALRQNYSGSIGYGTDTGYRMGLSYLDNRVTKKGHQFSSDLQLSQIERSLSAQYKIPIGNPIVEFFDFTLTAKEEDVNDTDLVQYAIGSSYNIELYNGILRSFISLEQEDFSFGNESSQLSNLLITGISYFKRQAKNTVFFRDGYSVFLQVKGGVRSVYSETSFLHGQINLKSVTSLSEKSRFLFRTEYGRIISDDFQYLPPSQRFFTGGSRTVRGFAFQTIAPENSNGITIGGNTLALASAEVDYLFNNNFGFATFYDIGDVTQDEDFTFKQSVGLGLRYRSPIGMIRVDLAKPIDSQSRDRNEGVRLHLSLGPDL